MANLSPERIRQLATTLANDRALAEIACIDYVIASDYLLHLDPEPDLAALDPDDQGRMCARIADLAKTATVTVTLPATAETSED